MASRRRTIDPELLQHPAFRRAGFIARELWIGLIIIADDEGRLRADPLTLAETVFSPLCHQVTATDIDTALNYWAEVGWLLRYEGNAFLTGWYEHQYIQPRGREESGIPPPPCAINSWSVADKVFDWYTGTAGKAKAYYRTALRAFAVLPEAEQATIIGPIQHRTSSEPVQDDFSEAPNQFGTSSKPLSRGDEPVPNQFKATFSAPRTSSELDRREGKGREGNTPLPPSGGCECVDQVEDDSNGLPAHSHYVTSNYPQLVALVERLYRDAWKPRKRLATVLAYVELLREPGCQLTEGELVAAWEADPPWPGSTPEGYMRHLHGSRIAARDAPEAEPRASPPSHEEIVQRAKALYRRIYEDDVLFAGNAKQAQAITAETYGRDIAEEAARGATGQDSVPAGMVQQVPDPDGEMDW